MKKNKIIISVLLFLLLIVGLGIRIRQHQQNSGTLSAPIQKGSIIESVYGIGTIASAKSFQLKAGVTNTIHELYVKEGDYVKSGQKLLNLDGANSFTAPFDGTITFLPFKVGENIFAQSVVLSLVDLSDRYIVVSLEQRGALRVKVGQKAKISFDSMREETFDGVVESVYSNDNNFFVRINVNNLPPEILPGMTADVSIGIVEHDDVLIVPVAAIENGKVFVKHSDGKTEPVQIKTGIVDGAMAEVVSGDLHAGDLLVLHEKVAP